ncbi:hypothetical protein BDA96_05G116700 [Sorghum bicolor]|uniref:Uncharacterized protein n=2 Tax=Sorghum bicolor TaxID=4558 RepID=A0A921QYR3_SORBI|nr:hypothetical protein BDA96_05G116700 [Sorghum bicolor]OQU83348.1 hypothetical protein SORBI_3005G110430 [Sorghum bicolor]
MRNTCRTIQGWRRMWKLLEDNYLEFLAKMILQQRYPK